jgi:hypothetical protein
MTRWSAPLVVLGLAGLIVAGLIDLRSTLAVYLAAAATVAALPLGAFAVLMTAYLVRGEWTEHLRVPLTAAALTMPVAGLLFVPVLLGMGALYPWTDPAARHGAFQAGYLVPWFFVARTIFYFFVWTLLALWARWAWGDVARMNAAASVGLIVYALTGSFAGIDWLESLEPKFHSSIYGLLVLTFQLVAGVAFATAMAATNPPRRDLGSYGALILSALLLWAYMHAMQYLIIWAGNIPDEVKWYLRRMEGGWMVVTWALLTIQFVLPFFALLSSRVRGGAVPLLVIAALTLASRFIEALWLVLPETGARGLVLLLAIPGAVLATGGLWLIGLRVSLFQVRRAPAASLDVAGRSA